MTNVQELQIPSFLLVNVSGNSVDRAHLVSDLQLGLLWLYVNGDKPYDHEAALRLQGELRTQRDRSLREQAEQRRAQIERNAKELLALQWAIGEHCFTCELIGNPDEVEPVGEVDWDAKIKDKVSGKSVGSPRDLWQNINLQFVGAVNPHADLIGYLDSIKAKFDEFERDFSFNRKFLNPTLRYDAGEKHFSFTLWLRWKPSSAAQVAKKLRKLLTQTAR